MLSSWQFSEYDQNAEEGTTKHTKDTKNYKNCIFRGNSLRGYVLESRVEFNLKEKARRSWSDGREMHFVIFVCFVVTSLSWAINA
jgi:hypothetical protein